MIDPDEALRVARNNTEIIRRGWKDKVVPEEAVFELQAAFHALDQWLSEGGEPPAAWQAPFTPPRVNNGND